MTRTRLLPTSRLLSIALLSGHLGSPATALAQVGVDPIVPGRAVVRVASGFTLDQMLAEFMTAHPAVSLWAIDAVPNRPIHLLAVSAPGVSDAALGDWFEAFQSSPTCAWAELLYEGQAPESKTGSTWTDTVADASTFYSQDVVAILGLEQAHARSTGRGVAVAVLDTGVDETHPILAGGLAAGGWDFVRGKEASGDAHGHGTFVAGLVRLVAPDAAILPVVVLDEHGKGDGWLFGRGLFHAIDSGAKVINLSLGSTYKAEVVEDALDEAELLGIAVVSAAGNLDRMEPEEFPAAMSSGLGVAATDPSDLKAAFSNFHPKIFISAPGAGAILGPIPGGGLAIWEGTSLSAAFVSGAVALLRSQHPEWACAAGTLELVEAILSSSAVGIDGLNPGYTGLLGVGRLDVGAATLLGPVAAQPGDLDRNGVVDGADLGILVGAWGATCGPADVDGSGLVDGADLGLVLAAWSG